jgi:hypothetical protein
VLSKSGKFPPPHRGNYTQPVWPLFTFFGSRRNARETLNDNIAYACKSLEYCVLKRRRYREKPDVVDELTGQKSSIIAYDGEVVVFSPNPKASFC